MAYTKRDKAYDILKDYNGNNPYILMLQSNVYTWKRYDSLDDFKIDFILRNHDKPILSINKIVKLAKWLGIKKKTEWNTDFIPEKIKIISYLGDTDRYYCCLIKYRQSVEPTISFLPKNGILTNFFVTDYSDYPVDFDRYDRLSMDKDNKRKLREHQKQGVRFLLNRKKCILADEQGLGKMEPVSSLIPTPNGFKRMGDIIPGDRIFGSDGKTYNVIDTFKHKNKDIYKVTFNDGTYAECGLEHLWLVKNVSLKKNKWEVMSLKEMLDKGLKYNETYRRRIGLSPFNRFKIPLTQPIDYPKKEFLIHPYVLGMCIGDGNLCNNGINISIPDTEREDAERISKLLDEEMTLVEDRSTNCPRYRIKHKKRQFRNKYITEIKRLGLNVKSGEKFIPEEYKLGSIEQRIELLRGLMDSDGSIKPKNKIAFYTTSKRLANDVVELVNSLGGTSIIHSYDRTKHGKGIEYLVSLRIEINPFHLRRKAEIFTSGSSRNKVRYVVSAECVRKEDAQCLMVDSLDHTYITGRNYIVTHNTTTLSVSAIEGNFDSVLVICPASLKSNWKNELMWYVPERDITIIDSINSKTKGELEEFLGYSVGKSGKKKDELLEEAKDKGKWQDNRFVIVNFDILDEFYKKTYAKSEKTIEKLRGELPMFKYLYNKKSLIIIDEAHKLSNNTSNRYKLVSNLIKMTNPDSIYLSTGTPVTNMPDNLFSLLKLLDAPITCDWDFFMKHYCGAEKRYANGEFNRLSTVFARRLGKGNYYDLNNDEKERARDFVDNHARRITVSTTPQNLDELQEAVSYLYLRRLKTEVTDLPNKYIHEIKYNLTTDQKIEYEKLWDEYEALKTEENPDIELNKSLLEGSVYRMYLSEQMIPNTIKLANDIISDGKKVVIACCYDVEVNMLKEYYGESCVVYNGKLNLKQKDNAIDKFKNDDNVKVFIGNIIAAGVGITLINSHNLIFNSFDYVYANNAQMEDRIHRIGQETECNIFYQMFEDTHCEHMWDIVLKKQYVSDKLIISQEKR